MSMLAYQKALDYLHYLLPVYEQDGAAAITADLTTIRELCYRLGLPQWKFNSIHVGGTNGKGSVGAMLASILKEAGIKTGLFSSPYLREFTEQIRVNGKEISKKEVVTFVSQHKETIEALRPSFFELTVALAFWHFARSQVELAVIEVGLGGQTDATNIISPEVSVITNVSHDHQQLLGESLGEIAIQKAGIMKKFTPVIVGERQAATSEVFEQQAASLQAPLRFASERVEVQRLEYDWCHQRFEVSGQLNEVLHGSYMLGLAGKYQAQNLACCLCTLEQLLEDGWDIPLKAIKKGLKRVRENTGITGRMHIIHEQPLTLCDTAHNVAGVQAVMAQLEDIPYQKLHVVWGMGAEKDHQAIIAQLPKDARYYFVQANAGQALKAEALYQLATAAGLQGQLCASVQAALEQARRTAATDDLILVGGSNYVVAEALG
ncbi:MAG: bifunctional folylpolyglutamate synthase/dihydrofolate synthase [Bacteroidetes bacterium]|nr:MAG: bifunctional folylpolyglutamate synthase/dihydrofolate synthase [Bacteroidota bacterium]